MAMPEEAIRQAVEERLGVQWSKRLIEAGAAPIIVIGIVQRAGPNFGQLTVCIPEIEDEHTLGLLVATVGEQLIREGSKVQHEKGRHHR